MNSEHDIERWLSWVDELSDKDYVVIDNFLTDNLYQKVRQYYLTQLPYFTQAGIGDLDEKVIKKHVRGDQTYWLKREEDSAIEAFWQVVDQLMFVFNRYCFLSLSDYEFHFANYPPGARYLRHLDQFQNNTNRIISVIIYLNENWQSGDGGELKIYRDNANDLIIEPYGGRCVMFKSAEVHHSVLESNKNRFSLTGWLLYQPAKVGQLLART